MQSKSVCSLIWLLFFLFLMTFTVFADFDRADERQSMVRDQILARGIKDPATIAALGKVPRHEFVPEEQSSFAYDDRPLPIGHGQTISQPYIVAFMTEIVSPGPGKRILEIGTGSGYQAAILAATGASVFTVEIIPELAISSRERLQQLGYRNVNVKNGDGYYGWPSFAPFDAIVVTAATEFIPPPLLEQLADGGLMIIPVGSPFFIQTLMLVQKKGQEIISTSMMPVRFVPFRRKE